MGNYNNPRCDACGKFYRYEAGTSWMFVPDSDLSREESAIQCKACTDKFGHPCPMQDVVVELCCGVNEQENRHG